MLELGHRLLIVEKSFNPLLYLRMLHLLLFFNYLFYLFDNLVESPLCELTRHFLIALLFCGLSHVELVSKFFQVNLRLKSV